MTSGDPPSAGPDGNDLPDAELLTFWREMMRIRRFEEAALHQSTLNNVYGTLHAYIGQEAVAVGVCQALRKDDWVASTHRGHGHCLAKGAGMDRMMAELFGRRDGYCRGKGGSQHIADFSVGMLGANGIVGAGFGLAAGAALRSKRRGDRRVAVAFFGDGAVSRGTFHEVMNLAALESLPLVFVCENNQWAQWVPSRENLAAPSIARLADGYGIPGVLVDGQDVRAVHAAASAAATRARSGGGPTLIECDTQRYYGHNIGDMQVYRSRQEIAELRARTDPVDRLERELVASGLLTEDRRRDLLASIDGEVEGAIAFALASPMPDPGDLFEDVFADFHPVDVTRRGR